MKEIIFVHNKQITTKSIKRDVTIRVMLPKSYVFGDESYPVLYMMDGQNLFNEYDSSYGGSWKFTETFDNKKYNLPDLIIVGIDNAGGYDIIDEYSPWEFSYDNNSYGGKADQFIKWIIGDLKPWIDKNYRTLSDAKYTAIGGSGMGGLLSTYAIMNYPNSFTRAATLSNAFWTVEDDIINNIKNKEIDHINYWYTYVGTSEVSFPKKFKKANDKIYKLLTKKGLNKRLLYDVVDGGTHNEESWAKVVPTFINFIFKDFKN